MVPPNTIPDEAQISLNGPVLLFSLAVSAAAALIFGLAPALHLSSADIMTPLREAGRGTAGGIRQRILRGVLVAGEVALSLMLLVGASLMIRTLAAIQGVNLAFHPERILSLRIPFSEQRYPDAARRNAFLSQVLDRIRAVPGVRAVGIDGGMPPVYTWGMAVQIEGATQPDSSFTVFHQTTEGYPDVMGIGLVQGRFFTAQEVNGRQHNAVVNQAFTRKYFPDGQAIGRMLRIPRLRSAPFRAEDDSFQIAGVVRDTVNRASTGEIVPEIFVPFTLTGMADRLLVLGPPHPESLARAIRAQVYAVDPLQPVMDEFTLDAVLAQFAYSRPRFNLLLFSVFADLGMILAVFGIYGVVSQAVSQQTREIGIRIALGAGFGQVIGMVLRMGLKLLAVGVAVGLAASLASVKVLSGLVRNVSTFDPYSFAAVTVLLVSAGLFASFWPARRAARVDPVTALREE
jgi:predicted permease